MEDFYKILEVPRDASNAKVKESYRRLALQLHPDKNPSPNATALFQQLGHAWETLKDPGTRRTYDIKWENELARKLREAEAVKKAQQNALLAEQKRRLEEIQMREAEAAAWKRQEQKRRERANEKKALDARAKASEAVRKAQHEEERKVRAAERNTAEELKRQGAATRASEVNDKRQEASTNAWEAAKKAKDAEVKRKEAEPGKHAQVPGERKRKAESEHPPRKSGGIHPLFSNSSGQTSTKQRDFSNRPAEPNLPKSKSPVLSKDTPAGRKLHIWKRATANEYEARVEAWNEVRRTIIKKIEAAESALKRIGSLVGDYNQQFEAYMEESMNYYLQLLHLKGRMMEGHILREMAQKNARDMLSRHEGLDAVERIAILKNLLEGLREELSDENAKFEKKEYMERQQKVTEALKFLPQQKAFHTRHQEVPPSLEMHRAMWASLGQIRPGWKFMSKVAGDLSEGPWHETYVLEHGDNLSMCGRCNDTLVKSDGRKPARCRLCDIVVCNNCHVDLEVLKEYAAWMEGGKPSSLFEATEEMFPRY